MDRSEIKIEMTPNPSAWKFMLPKIVIQSGNATFKSFDECQDIPLAAALIQVGHVNQLYFFENVITVTQDGEIDWNILADVLATKIADHLDDHRASSVQPDDRGETNLTDSSGILGEINAVLDETVRPALQGDGGDLTIIGYDNDTHVLRIAYQGACGSCPSATAGTMMAIQNILQEAVDSQIKVLPS